MTVKKKKKNTFDRKRFSLDCHKYLLCLYDVLLGYLQQHFQSTCVPKKYRCLKSVYLVDQLFCVSEGIRDSFERFVWTYHHVTSKRCGRLVFEFRDHCATTPCSICFFFFLSFVVWRATRSSYPIDIARLMIIALDGLQRLKI